MGKKHKAKSEQVDSTRNTKTEVIGASATTAQPVFLTGDTPIDPLLASLFEKSAGPVKAPSLQYAALPPGSEQKPRKLTEKRDREDDGDNDSSQQDGDFTSGNEEMQDVSDEIDEDGGDASFQKKTPQDAPSRKRKRGTIIDNLEDVHMQRMAREELKEVAKRRAEQAKKRKVEDGRSEADIPADEDENDDDNGSPPPAHETLTGKTEAAEIDKSSRTCFLGNVSNLAIKSHSAKKILLTHLSSFLTTLPQSNPPHKIASIRFRSTAYSTKLGVPRRAAYAHKEVMDATTASTNAYVVYSTTLAARKAPSALNGTVVLDRHLRVDSVAHPSPVDHKRCVFVGNLDFVNQANDENEDGDPAKKKKLSLPTDTEEGLWRTFNAHSGIGEKGSGKGNVESVRVVRDCATRVGKGFAYVQFYDPNCVEAALLLDGKKFPPLLPRKLRVSRAKKTRKRYEKTGESLRDVDSARGTLRGRAGKMLGKAGAAKVREADQKKPFVFEGRRATEGAPELTVKTKSRGADKGKPRNRSTRRAATYRATSAKYGKTSNKA